MTHICSYLSSNQSDCKGGFLGQGHEELEGALSAQVRLSRFYLQKNIKKLTEKTSKQLKTSKHLSAQVRLSGLFLHKKKQ